MLNRLKKLPLIEIALASIILGVHLRAAFAGAHYLPMRWFLRDDAYYYFKVAQNISQGLGSTFDGLNLTNGYHPLWLLICIPIFALARFDLILPLRIVLMVQAILSAGSSILLYRLLKRAISAPIALLAASFLAFDLALHNILNQQGLETGLLTFSLLTLLSALQRYQRAPSRSGLLWLSLAATFALFSRLDVIYLALLLGPWAIFRRTALQKILLGDLLFTFSALTLAVLQRANLKIYLAGFSDPTLLSAALLFGLQSLLFYFLGLYQHPKSQNLLRMSAKLTLAVGLSALFLGGLILVGLKIPRSAPLYYFSIFLPLGLGLRLGLNLFAPQPGEALRKPPSPLEELRSAWRGWLGEALIYFAPLGTALGAYLLFNRWMFGTSMPVSGQIKRWWGSLQHTIYGETARTWLDVFGLDPHFSAAWQPWLKALFTLSEEFSTRFHRSTNLTFLWTLGGALALAFILLYLQRKTSLPALARLGLFPLLIAAELHVFFYSAAPYVAKQEWYWVIEILAGLMSLSLLADSLLRWLPFQRAAQTLAWAAALIVSFSWASTFSAYIITRMPLSDAEYAGAPYIDMTTLLEQNTESGALIGMTGGGNVGYFIQDRTIVNLDGLINSYDYFRASQQGQGDEFLAAMGLEYIFANPDILTNSEPYDRQFQDRLQPLPQAPAYGGKIILKFLK